jgi:hypothetical protein
MKNVASAMFILLLTGCYDGSESKIHPSEVKPEVAVPREIENVSSQVEDEPIETIEEAHFWSNAIGAKGLYRLEMKELRSDVVIADIELFKKREGKWVLIQHEMIEKDGITSIDPKVTDFNNDGFLDLTFHYSTAARGANDVRKLYIFDTIRERLRMIKNSDHFPNLRYNNELDCIDAMLFYGCVATEFLRIDGDSLKAFAGVEACNNKISIYTYSKKGEVMYLTKDKIMKQFSDFPRFINYQPLKEYIPTSDDL